MKILGTLEGPGKGLTIYRFYDVFLIKHPTGMREQAIKFFEERLLREETPSLPKYDLVLFGRPYRVKEVRGKGGISLKNDKVVISGKTKLDRLKVLENLMKLMLIRKVKEIFSEFSSSGFKVPTKIRVTRSLSTLASVRGDLLKISLFNIGLPIDSLRALLSHETAHLYFPNHKEDFLRTMIRIFPEVLEVENPIDSFKRHFAMSLASLEIATSGSLWIYV